MINLITIMGRLTKEPELKHTTSGLAVCSFDVAVERNYQVNGERKTDFIPVVAWRGSAEFVDKYFSKGQMIAVTGSLETRTYEDRNGNKRTIYEVIANEISFCGDKAKPKEEPRQEEPENGYEVISDDSDLPF
ncbi:MAG: single-stranded DNA-binding protein [Oscillospiraceae bacterium]|nr:single-stranded DNA-binding protein [Oscillospiraceae bacterium]MBQ8996375.1 single-stranded DNA-binding protein [Oscillospiraceae bacterium]